MTELTPEKIERLSNCAATAMTICNAVPAFAEENDADVGMTALLLCGFLAGKIVGNEEGLISKEKFFEQMEHALAAELAVHHTEQ